VPERVNDIERRERGARDFGEHGLKNEHVLLGDQRHATNAVLAQRFPESARAIRASEPSTGNHDIEFHRARTMRGPATERNSDDPLPHAEKSLGEMPTARWGPSPNCGKTTCPLSLKHNLSLIAEFHVQAATVPNLPLHFANVNGVQK
jgi:hypothetical protein